MRWYVRGLGKAQTNQAQIQIQAYIDFIDLIKIAAGLYVVKRGFNEIDNVHYICKFKL